MEEIKMIVLTACSSLLFAEIVYYITPKDKLTNFVYGLLYCLIIISAVFSISKIDLNIKFPQINPYSDEINNYINEYYSIETKQELESIIKSSLKSVLIECSEVEVVVDVENDTVTVHNINVILKYKADVGNAKVILNEVFQGQIPLEVNGEK